MASSHHKNSQILVDHIPQLLTKPADTDDILQLLLGPPELHSGLPVYKSDVVLSPRFGTGSKDYGVVS